MSRKALTLLLVVVVAALSSLTFVSAQDDLSGTTVTVFGAFTDESEVAAINAAFDPLEEATGVEVIYEGASDFEILINTRVEAGDPPDIACFPQPGLMNRYSEEALDLTTFLDMEYLQGQYDQSWLDMATAIDGSGKVIGIWTRVIVKSLVWYNPGMFEDAGYDIPETWEELLELSDQIVADGGVPWSIAMESGQATGWVGTDWIEDIMLRTTTLENYDAWTLPPNPEDRLLFDSEPVRAAFETFGVIALNSDYVLGGVDRMLGVEFFDNGVPLMEETAYMTKMGSFMPPWLDPDTYDVELAEDGNLWYFVFPPINEDFGTPVLTSGDVCSVFIDRPEVRAVAEWLTLGESLRPGIESGVFYSPHLDADQAWYPAENAGIAEILASADSFRFDGGDLQPAPVGQGTFWQGIVDFVSGGDLDDILPAIDAAWPTE
jgi:alpha-glucoside transport system substrate-binding protein